MGQQRARLLQSCKKHATFLVTTIRVRSCCQECSDDSLRGFRAHPKIDSKLQLSSMCTHPWVRSPHFRTADPHNGKAFSVELELYLVSSRWTRLHTISSESFNLRLGQHYFDPRLIHSRPSWALIASAKSLAIANWHLSLRLEAKIVPIESKFNVSSAWEKHWCQQVHARNIKFNEKNV
jgi:hypothetical protein